MNKRNTFAAAMAATFPMFASVEIYGQTGKPATKPATSGISRPANPKYSENAFNPAAEKPAATAKTPKDLLAERNVLVQNGTRMKAKFDKYMAMSGNMRAAAQSFDS